MNPGLVVKLRPAGPWRIGPDSGARNRVDVVYHSDSLYSAVTFAMSRLGSLDEWLNATARSTRPAVCFSSCFPFVDELVLVVPPRTIWPPTSPARLSTHLRWKSARFVPLAVVQAILAGQPLDESQWSVDAASECLVPAGAGGPFRTGIRWSAAVDRLTGATERHSTACLEFRAGCGLWTAVSFRDEAAHAHWAGPVRAAFRLLADTGFGGERSRGWGRSEAPEFAEGDLPAMILAPAAVHEVAPTVAVHEPAPEPAVPEVVPAAVAQEAAPAAVPEAAPAEAAQEPVLEAEVREAAPVQPLLAEPLPEVPAVEAESTAAAEAAMETESPAPAPQIAAAEPSAELPPLDSESTAIAEAAMESESPAPAPAAPVPEPRPAPAALPAARTNVRAHWLLSLFTPAAADSVDWARGNYTLTARSGRIESPAGSGELKKQVQMVTEGSVLYAAAAPCGAAPDVAPEGFGHPVFRAGFALSIPLPEVS